MTFFRAAFATTLTALTVASPAFAGDNPFVGTWKLNQEQSQLVGDTMTFTAKQGENIRVTAGGQSYTFKPNGKDYDAATRYKVAWTRADDRTWRAVWKLKKKPVYTETLQIAPDGKSLTDSVKGARVDGTSFEDSSEYERISGEGTALIGRWRSTKTQVGGLRTLVIEPRAHNGIILTMTDFKSACAAHLDGEDYAFKGPMTPPGLTLSFRPKGERELHIIEKQNGVPLYTGSIVVDPDGKTLTWTWRPPAVDEPMRAVFDRQ